MTAYIAYATTSALHVVSDRAQTIDDGTVASFEPKIAMLPGMRAALLVSGQSAISKLFAWWIEGRVTRFDDLTSNLASVFADFERKILDLYPEEVDLKYVAVVAGWPERGGRPEIWSITGSEHKDKSRHSGNDENGILTYGSRAEMPAELIALGHAHQKAWKAGAEPPPFNAELHALPYFQAMRRNVSEGFSSIGGALDEGHPHQPRL